MGRANLQRPVAQSIYSRRRSTDRRVPNRSDGHHAGARRPGSGRRGPPGWWRARRRQRLWRRRLPRRWLSWRLRWRWAPRWRISRKISRRISQTRDCRVWLWTLLRRILSLRGQRLLRRWRLLRRPSPRDDALRLASSSRPSLRINIFTGKTRRLNPAGLSCEECQRRSSLLTFILRESGRAERDCEVVQCDQGLWFYSTGRRNKGRVRPYLGR